MTGRVTPSDGPNESVTALVLAGGASVRMGAAKLLLEHEGTNLLARAVASARRVCARVVVVVGAHAEAYRPVAAGAGAEVVENPDWTEGLAASLRAGVAAVTAASGADRNEGVLVLLADQPFVTAGHLRRLLESSPGAELVFSRYPDGTRGAPAFVHRRLFSRVAELAGDRGARALTRFAAVVAEVELDDPRDIDTPEEAARWLDQET